ncbi:SgcJ/EcaC family oxidoreductase [Actinosynnema sp. NPDC023794]
MSNVGRTRSGAITAVALAVTLTACGTASGNEQPATATTAVAEPSAQEVAALFGAWNRALATGDARQVADLYAPDAVLLPTLSDNVRSDRAEIVDYFEHFLANKPSGEILESHVAVLGPDTAIDAGVYRFTLAANGTQVDARYTFAYERLDGKWLIVNHHSSAMPEAH